MTHGDDKMVMVCQQQERTIFCLGVSLTAARRCEVVGWPHLNTSTDFSFSPLELDEDLQGAGVLSHSAAWYLF